jgi:hypothetical protein
MLEEWSHVAGRSGLPQRCNASSILANFYLRPIDDVIKYFGRQDASFESVLSSDVAATRWMDDVWLFGNDRGRLRQAQLQLQAALGDLGLDMSAAKTRVIEGDDLMQAAKEVEHSGVERGLADEPPDFGPLTDLVDHLVAQRETASATSIKFATVRMRDRQMFDEARKFVDVAPRMPHGSSALARLFRDSEIWRDLLGWYRDYATSSWGSVGWAVAQFGTMFPTDAGLLEPVAGVFEASIERPSNISMVALAAQRLATWDSARARQLFREAGKHSANPHVRRILALAGLAADEEVNWIRAMLSEFEETAITLEMLEERGFASLPTVKDFEGD